MHGRMHDRSYHTNSANAPCMALGYFLPENILMQAGNGKNSLIEVA